MSATHHRNLLGANNAASATREAGRDVDLPPTTPLPAHARRYPRQYDPVRQSIEHGRQRAQDPIGTPRRPGAIPIEGRTSSLWPNPPPESSVQMLLDASGRVFARSGNGRKIIDHALRLYDTDQAYNRCLLWVNMDFGSQGSQSDPFQQTFNPLSIVAHSSHDRMASIARRFCSTFSEHCPLLVVAVEIEHLGGIDLPVVFVGNAQNCNVELTCALPWTRPSKDALFARTSSNLSKNAVSSANERWSYKIPLLVSTKTISLETLFYRMSLDSALAANITDVEIALRWSCQRRDAVKEIIGVLQYLPQEDDMKRVITITLQITSTTVNSLRKGDAAILALRLELLKHRGRYTFVWRTFLYDLIRLENNAETRKSSSSSSLHPI